MDRTERAQGVLLGLARGDAPGRPVEGWSGDRIDSEYGRLEEMGGGGVHGRPAGTITDDAEQALCIARSLADLEQFAPADVAGRFVAWFEDDPVGVGGMTYRVLGRLQRGQSWDVAGQREWEASPEGRNAGNGSVMRTAPVAVAGGRVVGERDRVSRDCSRITHADPRCTYGCVLLDDALATLLRGEADDDPAVALERALDRHVPDAPDELVSALEPVPYGLDRRDLSPTGYVVDALQAALWFGLRADATTDAVVAAVNRGGDTDTIAAMAGAVAGARFGPGDLPDRWLGTLPVTGECRDLAGRLVRADVSA